MNKSFICLVRWLTCTSGGAHPARRLLLTQIAPGGALAAAAQRAHDARAAFALPCACGHCAPPRPQRRARARLLLQQALHNVTALSITSYTQPHFEKLSLFKTYVKRMKYVREDVTYIFAT